MLQTNRLREGIIRVNLDGQWLCGEQQLEEQCGICRVHVGALKLELADRYAIAVNVAPWPEIGAPPGFTHGAHTCMFDRHDFLPVEAARIGST
jgi:hypothetical protein